MIKAYRRTSFRYDFIRENHEKEINFSFKFVSQEGKDKKKPHFKGLNLHFEFFNIKNEFNHIGNNLNQIARALNNRQDISLKTIMETIKELRQMIKNLDEKVRG